MFYICSNNMRHNKSIFKIFSREGPASYSRKGAVGKILKILLYYSQDSQIITFGRTRRKNHFIGMCTQNFCNFFSRLT